MLNIFSCASWPSVCLLWRNVYLGVLPIFLTVQLFGLSLKTETKEYVVSQFRGKHKRHTDFFLTIIFICMKMVSAMNFHCTICILKVLFEVGIFLSIY